MGKMQGTRDARHFLVDDVMPLAPSTSKHIRDCDPLMIEIYDTCSNIRFSWILDSDAPR